MSDVKSLLAKSETVEVEGVSFVVDPIDTDDPVMLALMDSEVSTQDRLKAVIGHVDLLIKKNYPDLSDEEVKKIFVNVKTKLAEHVLRVNKLSGAATGAEAEVLKRVK